MLMQTDRPAGAVAAPLPILDAAGCEWSKHVFGRVATSRLTRHGQACVWRWIHEPAAVSAPAAALALDLVAGNLRASLVFAADSGTVLDNTIDLDAFEGRAWEIAALLRYAAVLAHFDAITGRAWDCCAVRQPAPAGGAQQLVLGFEVGPLQEPGSKLFGRMVCAAESAAWLLQLRGEPAGADPALTSLPMTLAVMLDHTVALSAAEISRLVAGSAILLGAKPGGATPCCLHLGTPESPAWRCELERAQLRLLKPVQAKALAQPMSTNPMNTHTDELLQTLPVVVEFQIGTITVPWSELPALLAAGQVIELDRQLDGNAVTVLANGRPLAHGELAQVGQSLAVRITQRVAGDGGSV